MTAEPLIVALTQELRVIKHTSYVRVCVEWMAVVALSFLTLTTFQSLRPDLIQQLHMPLFAGEMILNLLLILLAGLAATAFAYPDRARASILKPCLLLVFAAYSLLVLITASSTPDLLNNIANTAPHGIRCLLCILSFALIPALWMFYRLRQLAITQPFYAGAATLMMAVATGCLGVRLVETEIVPSGLIVWHYLPLWAVSGMGFLLGKKIFRW